MIRLLTLCACLLSTPALAETPPTEEDSVLEEIRDKAAAIRQPNGGPRFRIQTGMIFRRGVNATFQSEWGIQVWRGKQFSASVTYGVQTPGALRLIGPWRQLQGAHLVGEFSWQPSILFSTGPRFGAALRDFRQQWSPVRIHVQPVVGWQFTVAIFRMRTWSLNLMSSVMVDTIPIRMVNDTAEIVTLAPVSGQFGLSWHFGHGRVR